MTEKPSKSIINGVIASLIAAAIIYVVAPLRNFIFSVFIWTWSGISWSWHCFFKQYSLPGWLILIGSGFTIFGLIKILAWLLKTTPHFHWYTEDSIYNTNWRWNWNGDTITNLWCFCPTCDAELVYDDSSCRMPRSNVSKTDFICENCSSSLIASISGGNKLYALGAVEREIRRRIRTSEYDSKKLG